ncbi:TPRXL protein [Cucumis melo var. makuwa]|uniref:TPRXL protein n=1 Tax=Cucumis melo var. makuwa TaxID=1194695 RepID=A0A5D3D748_CUCMM|nr:TPRXL protein [Cucumis melo var. makuwa]
MDHNGNSLRIKIKIRNSDVPAAKVDDCNDNDCKKQFCSIDHMGFDSETPMDKGLLFQASTPMIIAATRGSSPSPSPTCDIVDCSKFLHSWPLTGRRGRKSISSATTSSTTTTDTVVDVISSDRLNTKRVKTETHSDHEKSVRAKENKNNGVLEKKYKCNMCSKVFASPKALGGHKSGHYKANKTVIAIKKENANATIGTTIEPKIMVSTVASSTDRTDQKSLMMDFDLNRLPPKEAILESCFLHL